MNRFLTNSALAIAAAGSVFTAAAPAVAIDLPAQAPAHYAPLSAASQADAGWDNHRDYRRGDRYYGRERTWRGRDGRYYCRKSNGTTGLLIGGVGGALVGRAIDSRGDRALGTILGAGAGALLGREVDRSSSESRCR